VWVTNTLHRYGNADSFRDDYIIFAMPSKGNNDVGSVEKLRQFLTICVRHRPANIGASGRSSYRPSAGLNPSVHWKRDLEPDFQTVINGVRSAGTAGAVFDSRANAVACLREVIDADLGLSVNISTSVDGAKEVGRECGIERHSVEYSLGFQDPKHHLPRSQILELATMCGHGMVSFSFAQKMIDLVREGRRTPAQAVAALTRFCPCGVYNPSRATRLIEDARTHS
jgi:hypothetical protein